MICLLFEIYKPPSIGPWKFPERFFHKIEITSPLRAIFADVMEVSTSFDNEQVVLWLL